MADNIDKVLAHNQLAHHGVPGMKWGKHKGAGSSSSPSRPQKTTGFFNNPTVAKSIVLGSFGKKRSYTNPAALQLRKSAGRLRIASALTAVGSNAVGVLGKNNGGAQAVSLLLGYGAGGLSVASVVQGAKGAHQEQMSRAAGH